MSYHEKSAWFCLGSILLVYTPYFAVVFRYPLASLGLFVIAAVVLTAVLSCLQIGYALFGSERRQILSTGTTPQPDELERLIELRAARTAGVVLGVVVLVWSLAAVYMAPAVGFAQQLTIPLGTAMLAIHLLFAGFVLANLVYYGALIVSYRKLASG